MKLSKHITMNSISPTLPISVPQNTKEAYPISVLENVKQKLETRVTHPAIIIPSPLTAKLRNVLKGLLMNKPKLRDIYPLEAGDAMPGIDPKTERKIVLSDKVENIFANPLVKTILDDRENPSVRKSSYDVILGYGHLTVDEVLSKVLPKELSEIPSSFEVVGHLAHMNLRQEYYPFKKIIGRVVLDKNKGIQVCVNKTGTIQNEFRTFPMETLADDRKLKTRNDSLGLLVEVKEDGCRFQLDFEKVYWNSRLQFEHRRIVHYITGKERPTNLKKRCKDNKEEKEKLPEKIIVADACAGIGPFAVPLTSQYENVEVHANDLNPVSYDYLQKNAKLNKCANLKTYNMDGRYFLRKLDEENIHYDHVLMNLPAIAPEFLDVFRGWKVDRKKRPMIHVHCFGSKIKGDIEVVERCSVSLGCKLDWSKDEVSVHEVRNVSPKKNMYCVSFRLPDGVKHVDPIIKFGDIVAKDDANDDCDGAIEPATKKPRLS
uniref:tRNA (guanine(37)-N1)-methyltransferase n=1 Tax=Chaetoceros debilis TaxID=122233 RepID=A0A6S8SY41_9STRA